MIALIQPINHYAKIHIDWFSFNTIIIDKNQTHNRPKVVFLGHCSC